MTLNGGTQISDKVEPLDAVKHQGLVVDRHFYLGSLRKAIDKLFSPIIEQRLGTTEAKAVRREAERLLWSELLEGRLTQDPLRRQEQLSISPIAKAFAPKSEDPQPKRVHQLATLTANSAERSQMREKVAKKQAEQKEKKQASMAQSPLLQAFARQANAKR